MYIIFVYLAVYRIVCVKGVEGSGRFLVKTWDPRP